MVEEAVRLEGLARAYRDRKAETEASMAPERPTTTYWENPWPNAVPVRIEHLAEAIACGVTLAYRGNTVGNPEYLVEQWHLRHGQRLDAYVLTGREANVGIRYGADGDQYLSPSVRPESDDAVRDLLKRASEPDYVVRRPRVYLDMPAGSEERQNAFEEHIEAIVQDAREAYDPDDNPYERSAEPHESNAWRGGAAMKKLGF